MDLFLLFAFLSAAHVVIGRNPAEVCYAPFMQMSYFNLLTEDKGNISVDFTKELWAEISFVTGNRIIHDFSKLKTYAISGEGNFTTCKSYKLRQSQITQQCLPPYARAVDAATGKNWQNVIETWDIPTEYETYYRVSLTYYSTDKDWWPVMSQQYGYHGTTDVFIYLGLTTASTNLHMFNIPNVCLEPENTLATIVG